MRAQDCRCRIERDRGGIRYVQALDRARQFQPRADIAGLPGELAQAAALRAKEIQAAVLLKA